MAREINDGDLSIIGDVAITGDLAFTGEAAGEGYKYIKLTGIVGSAQTVIANGAGDVTQVVTGFFTLSDGTSGVANGFAMIPTDTYDIAVGGSTWRITCAANGELSVQRVAGSGTATMTFLVTWI